MRTSTAHLPAPQPRTAAVDVPRWVRLAAHAVPLLVLPSGLWRLAVAAGIPVGFTGELAQLFEAPSWPLTPYLVVLSLVAEGLALLTLGLVQPWGEVLPRWLPWIGGRPLPAFAVVVPAALGALAVTALACVTALAWNGPENNGDPDAPQGVAGLVMTAAYAPMLAWGPLLGVVTVAYWMRRTSSPSARRRDVT
jgi:hypothetical protein